MANSFVRYTGDGSTATYSVPFSYRAQEDVSITIDGVVTTAFTWNGAGTQVTFTTAPASSTAIEIRRTTSQGTKLVDYASGSVLTESDLDTDSDQAFFMSQEAIDDAGDVIKLSNANFQWDTQNKRLTNVADPTSAQDAATKNYLETTWLSASDKANINTVSGIASAVSTVSGNTTNVNTVAGISSNVTTTAGIAGNITTTAGISSDVTSVATNASNVTTTAGSISNVNTVAGNIANVNTVATNISDVVTVANDLNEAISEIETAANDLNETTSEIDVVATNIANVNTVGGNITNVNAVAGELLFTDDLGSITGAITTGTGNDINTVAGGLTDVTTVASSINNVNTTAGAIANVNTVAGISSDVTTVSSNASNVTTVAGISSAVSTVAADGTDIGVVAGAVTNVNNVGGSIANVNTVAGISSDVSTVAADGTDIGTVATDIANVNTTAGAIANVNTTAGAIANVNTVAGISSDVTSVAGISSNVTAVANDSTDIGTVASDIANVNTTAGAIANVNTVASNIAGVNSFADRYRIGSSDPTSSLDEGDLAYNSTDNALKYYNGSSWASISAGLTDIVGDVTPQLGGNLDLNSNNISGTGSISCSGNVGIGTTSPSEELHISKSSDVRIALENTSNRRYDIISGDSGEFRIFDTAVGERIRIDNNGNVGIGTSNPTAKLTVSGDLVVETIDGTNLQIDFGGLT
jgi:hypothetical protein